MSEPEYKPTKDDILTMLHHLRISLPVYATPENAIKLINYQHEHLKALEELHPDLIEEILKDFEKH